MEGGITGVIAKIVSKVENMAWQASSNNNRKNMCPVKQHNKQLLNVKIK